MFMMKIISILRETRNIQSNENHIDPGRRANNFLFLEMEQKKTFLKLQDVHLASKKLSMEAFKPKKNSSYG